MQINLLGPIEVTCARGKVALGVPKSRAVLAILALAPGETVSPERLIDGLWGDEPPASAGKLVQSYVSQLRKALAACDDGEVIATHGRGYALQLPRDRIDVGRFERLLAQGEARQALDLWRGTPLADLAREPFAGAEIRRLEELRATAHEVAIDQDLDAGRHRDVLPELEGLLAQEPLRERLYAQQMLALYRCGRQAAALEAYRRARQTLVDEIGIEPGPELRRLHEAILRQDPSLEPPPEALPALAHYRVEAEAAAEGRLRDAATRTSAERAEWRAAEDDLVAGIVELQVARQRSSRAARSACPFKGLEAFDVDDAPDFFGRERLIADMVARLSGTRLMGVLGPSGSGKSSALRAGLLAALADGILPGSAAWPHAIIRPGDRPVAALGRARHALGEHERAVLAIDQFEELFTASRNQDERAAFVEALVACARDPHRRTIVILALRADFYDRCAEYSELARMLGSNQVVVGPMHRDELRRAIELPAQRAGVGIDPELVTRLIADIEGQPGGLPLLSTALMELWQERHDSRLELAAYERSGGVRGAVARLAEGAFERLEPAQRLDARRLLLRLAGEGDVRTRVPLADLNGGGQTLSLLANDRLVTISEGEVEVAHEALLREWPRLRTWLEEDREGRRLHRHLAGAARDWDARGRDPGDLYRGARLVASNDWAVRHEEDLNDLEREFLAASRAAAEVETQRERRAIRRLRILLTGAAVLLLVAVAAGAVALSQRGQARNAALVADAQRLGAEALSNERLDQALLLARAGVELDDALATRSNLLAVLLRRPAALGELRGHGWPLYAVAASADGRLIAVGDERGEVIVYDARTRKRIGNRYRAAEGLVQHLVFAPDGRSIALTVHGEETFVDVVAAHSGKRIRRFKLPAFPEQTGFVLALAEFARNGRDLVAQQTPIEFPGGGPAVLTRLSADTGRAAFSRRIGRHSAWSLSTTPDRHALFVTSPEDDATYELDPTTLRTRQVYGHGGAAGAVSADGRTFALGGSDGSVSLLDLRNGRLRTLDGRHEGGQMKMVFAPDGKTLVTSDDDGVVIVWDVARGAIRERLDAHVSRDITPIAVSPDSRTLYSASTDGRMAIWDLAGDRRLDRRFDAGPALVLDNTSPKGLALSPDGRTLAVTQLDGTVELIDARTLALRHRARALDGAALAADFSPDGRTLAVSGTRGQVVLLDAATLVLRRKLDGLPDSGFSQAVAFSPDGGLVAAGASVGTRGVVRSWDRRSGRVAALKMDIPAVALAFSPDGRLLAAAGIENGAQVRDVRSGQVVARLKGADFPRSVAFSPDGRRLAVGYFGGSVRFVSSANWKPVGRRLDRHRARVTALEFEHRGRVLVTGAADGTILLWDAVRQRPIGTPLTIEPDAYVSATFSPKGSYLFAVPSAGRAVRWDIRPESWERHACLVAGRDLTAREWRDALPERPYRSVCGDASG